MIKGVYFFNEMAYSAYPQAEAERLGYTAFRFPNTHFNPDIARSLYGMYLDELVYATESGFDGVVINEHHNNPLNMMPGINLIGAILARITSKGSIVLLGNVLPIHENPVRVAEEVAMMDTISGGRVICGFVRGNGMESLAANVNPAFNRERFKEAHDIIIKAWTTPGPFRWDGDHFHYRTINPWVLPVQKPHPPIWVPGITSPETIVWAAQHKYTYIAQNTSLAGTPLIWKLYEEAAQKEGYTATKDSFGYLQRIFVADTDEQAYKEGRHFYWQLGRTFGRAPAHWRTPPGYRSKTAQASAASITEGRYGSIGYEDAQQIGQVITGSPNTVIEKLKTMLDVVDPSWLVLWAREGPMEHRPAMRCLQLLGNEVIPAIKEYVSSSAR